LTFGVIGAMFRDTFKANAVLFLNLFSQDGQDAYEIQERCRLILEEFSIPYHSFDFLGTTDEELDKMAAIIEPYMEEIKQPEDLGL
jgi:hypothetical protein